MLMIDQLWVVPNYYCQRAVEQKMIEAVEIIETATMDSQLRQGLDITPYCKEVDIAEQEVDIVVVDIVDIVDIVMELMFVDRYHKNKPLSNL